MKNGKSLKVVGLLLIAGNLLITSCHLNYYSSEEQAEEVNYIEEKTLFEKQGSSSGGDVAAGGETTGVQGTFDDYVFTCSDTKYLGGEGSTLWAVTDLDGDSDSEFRDFTVDVHKSSGNAQAGYGVIFCQNLDEEKGQSLLCVLININGYYCIGKLKEDTFEKMRDWTFSSNLYAGYTSNKITIKKNENKYEIYFNGCQSAEFFDKEPVLSSGGRGFVAVISPKEKFPQQSVNISYRIYK